MKSGRLPAWHNVDAQVEEVRQVLVGRLRPEMIAIIV